MWSGSDLSRDLSELVEVRFITSEICDDDEEFVRDDGARLLRSKTSEMNRRLEDESEDDDNIWLRRLRSCDNGSDEEEATRA